MVTLTYRDDVDWSPRQVSNYLKCVREWARRKGIFIHYVWVLELTKRGRPHYHVLFGCLKGVSMPKADKQGWWKHGMTRSGGHTHQLVISASTHQKALILIHGANYPVAVVCMVMAVLLHLCVLQGFGVLLLVGFVN